MPEGPSFSFPASGGDARGAEPRRPRALRADPSVWAPPGERGDSEDAAAAADAEQQGRTAIAAWTRPVDQAEAAGSDQPDGEPTAPLRWRPHPPPSHPGPDPGDGAPDAVEDVVATSTGERAAVRLPSRAVALLGVAVGLLLVISVAVIWSAVLLGRSYSETHCLYAAQVATPSSLGGDFGIASQRQAEARCLGLP